MCSVPDGPHAPSISYLKYCYIHRHCFRAWEKYPVQVLLHPHPRRPAGLDGGIFFHPHTAPPLHCLSAAFSLPSGAFLPLPPRPSDRFPPRLSLIHHIIISINFSIAVALDGSYLPFVRLSTDTVTPFGSITLLTAQLFHCLF